MKLNYLCVHRTVRSIYFYLEQIQKNNKNIVITSPKEALPYNIELRECFQHTNYRKPQPWYVYNPNKKKTETLHKIQRKTHKQRLFSFKSHMAKTNTFILFYFNSFNLFRMLHFLLGFCFYFREFRIVEYFGDFLSAKHILP